MPSTRRSVTAYGAPSENASVSFSAMLASPNIRQMGQRWVDADSATARSDEGLWISGSWGWVHAVAPGRAHYIPKSKTVRWRNMQPAPLDFHVRHGDAIIPSARHGSLPPARSVATTGSHSIAHTDDACWLVVDRCDEGVIVLKISDNFGCNLCPEAVGVGFGAEWRAVAHPGSPASLSDTASSASGRSASDEDGAAAPQPHATDVLELPRGPDDISIIIYTRPRRAEELQPAPPVGGTAAPHESATPEFPLPLPERRFGVSVFVAAGYECFVSRDPKSKHLEVSRTRCTIADVMERYHTGHVLRVARVAAPDPVTGGILKQALSAQRVSVASAAPDVDFARGLLAQLQGNGSGMDVPDWVTQ